MKFFGFIFMAVIFGAVAPGRAATNDLFSAGTAFHRAGQFPEAAKAFKTLAQAQPAAGTLVNLGVAEWQRGRAGAAILAWEQARWIDPFDTRAGADLQFARAVAQVEGPPLKWFESASTCLPPNAWFWLAGVSLWLAVGVLVLPGFFRRRKAGWHQTLAALAFGLFLFCLTANLGVVSRTQIGFVLTKKAPLLLTPTQAGEVISILTAGAPARCLRSHGNYLFISTADESGWVERNEFELVCPSRGGDGSAAANN